MDLAAEIACISQNTSSYAQALQEAWEKILPEFPYNKIINQYIYSEKMSTKKIYDFGISGVRSLTFLIELFLSTFMKIEICNDRVCEIDNLKRTIRKNLKLKINENEKNYVDIMFERFFSTKKSYAVEYQILCKQYYYQLYYLNRILGDEISKRIPQSFGIIKSNVKTILEELLGMEYGQVLDYLWIYSKNNMESNIGAYLGNLFQIFKNNGIDTYDDNMIGEIFIISKEQLGTEYRLQNFEEFPDNDIKNLKVEMVFPGWTYNDLSIVRPCVSILESFEMAKSNEIEE